ncbi:uncharacterized protein LOC106658833 [Trichogramma pretiosum]|uniref:uncharacterized protein LOC106658833 n=1 Tax=Trichogramma pretiosum TaxID=7493 RepID=UPI0006C97463|nr:uncharacterized protein LOC106658833 [Trichogramma pretiosum]
MYLCVFLFAAVCTLQMFFVEKASAGVSFRSGDSSKRGPRHIIDIPREQNQEPQEGLDLPGNLGEEEVHPNHHLHIGNEQPQNGEGLHLPENFAVDDIHGNVRVDPPRIDVRVPNQEARGNNQRPGGDEGYDLPGNFAVGDIHRVVNEAVSELPGNSN